MKRVGLVRWLAMAGVVAAGAIVTLPHPARASFPIPYAFVGCITDGRFQSGWIKGPDLVHPALKELAGKTIRVEGSLSPGDSFRAHVVFIVNEQCVVLLHRRYLLCDPCATLPHLPHKDVPRQEPGTEIKLPPEALKEFTNFGRPRS